MNEPAVILNGLAVYSLGDGPPLLLVPDPQGFVTSPSIDGPLARLLARDLDREVITFDPPGAFRSFRRARLGLGEMLDCIEEVLTAIGVHRRIDIVAHGQATLTALAHALERPDRVRRMVLVGALAGGVGAIRRTRGLPWTWGWRDARFWHFNRLAVLLAAGAGTLRDQKRLLQLVAGSAFVDRTKAPPIEIEPDDARRPASKRARWQLSVRGLDLRDQLRRVVSPTLVCAGRFDPVTPVRASEEVARAINGSRLAIFENSGHYPFLEEPHHFRAEVGEFLR